MTRSRKPAPATGSVSSAATSDERRRRADQSMVARPQFDGMSAGFGPRDVLAPRAKRRDLDRMGWEAIHLYHLELIPLSLTPG